MGKLGIRLNLTNGGLTQVTNWDFNSVAVMGETPYGASSEGLAEIGKADKDNGANIDSFIEVPTSDYSIPSPKRIRKGYLGYRADGALKVECKVSDGESFTVTIPKPKTIDKETSKVFYGNRNYAGSYWEFTLSNVDGADFAIDYLGVLFLPLTRHRSL